MTITTLSSREFNQRASEAQRVANHGPVFITDRGRPAHVLMSFKHYQRLTQQRRNIADALAMPGIADIEFDPPRATIDATALVHGMTVVTSNVADFKPTGVPLINPWEVLP